MASAIRTLTVRRRHARIAEPRLGYELSVPDLRLPDEPLPDDPGGRPAALGWELPPIPKGSVDEIDVTGLAAPSAWERCYVDWLAYELDARVRWETAPSPETPARSAAGARLQAMLAGTDAWTGPQEIPEGVIVRRAESHRVEAREAAWEIRQWLQENGGLEASDRVLVMLPRDRLMAEVWRRELEEAGVPGKIAATRPLADTPFSRWVLSLAELAGWSPGSARPVATLREAVESPFWSREQCGLSYTGRLGREALLSVRRPEVTLDGWRAHLAARRRSAERKTEDGEVVKWGAERAERIGAFAAFTDGLAEQLRLGPGLIRRFHDLLFETAADAGHPCLAVRNVARGRFAAAQESELDPAIERIAAMLEKLADQEAAAGGIHERIAAGQSLATLLGAELEKAFLYRRFEPEHGVAVVPYEQYDGRESELLVLAGLGENGFPAVPAPPTQHQEKWIEALAMTRAEIRGETATRWIVTQIEQQIDVARAAIARCGGGMILSFSTQGSGTEIVHPGSLLSLLVGGWEEKIWAAGGARLRDCPAAAEIPMRSAAARGVREATSFAADGRLRAELARLAAADASGAIAARLEGTSRLENSLVVDRLRSPEVGAGPDAAPVEPTAHTGRLPAPAELPEAYSASALMTYGDCPARYFLQRVLGVNDPSEAAATPAPHEMGNLLHEAFDTATRAAIREEKAWKLTYDEKVPQEEVVERALERISAEVDGLIGKFLEEEPTTSPAYLRRLAASWKLAIKGWLDGHVEVFHPADSVPVDEVPEVAKALAEYEALVQLLDGIHAKLSEFEAAYPGFDKKEQTQAAWKRRAETLGLSGAAMQRAHDAWKEGRGAAEVSRVLHGEAAGKLEGKIAKALEALENAREREELRRALRFNKHICASEVPFGGTEETPPLALSISGKDVPVRGLIDRIDFDEERCAFAIRDYKSGRDRSDLKLKEDLIAGGGYLFQVLLYLVAVEQLIAEGKLEALAGSEAHHVVLEFLRELRPRGFRLPNMPSDYSVDGMPATWADIARAWIAHHAHGIESGRFDHRPVRCPKDDGKSPCDYRSFCPYREGTAERFADGGRPLVESIGSGEIEKKPPKKDKYAIPLSPWRTEAFETMEERRAKHEEGMKLAVDLDRDVLLAAGAGTGKTYNLVRRYVAAIESGCRPGEIVCVTFTRRAAAEMKHRVRQALMDRSTSENSAIAALRSNPRRFRDLVLSLSGAPFWTIDSLAGHVLRHLRETESHGTMAAVEGLDEAAAEAEVRAFVAQRLLDELDTDPRLDELARRIHVGRLPDVLASVLDEAEPDWVTNATDVASLAKLIFDRWWDAVAELERGVETAMRAFPLDDLEAAFETARADGEPTPETVEKLSRALAELRALRGLPSPDRAALWRTAKAVAEAKVVKDNDGKFLYEAWKATADWREGIAGKNTAERTLLEAWIAAPSIEQDTEHWAKTTALALIVCRDWRKEIDTRLEKAGKLRFRDVEARALARLQEIKVSDDSTAKALRERIPAKHIFVDESQDTSGAQLALIGQLAKVCGARLFWVGDVKQSIYRFRSAEVDVFDELVRKVDERSRGSLRENWRSDPVLIESFNRLFCAMLPAMRDETLAVDPGSEMPYHVLTWPSRKADGEGRRPAITLFAQPGHGFGTDGANEGILPRKRDKEEEGEEETFELTPSGVLLVEEIRKAIEEAKQRPKDPWRPGSPPHVAVLVSKWSRAIAYNEALRHVGVRATVQGGRGLLSTPEVASLIWWLRMAAQRSEAAVTGILRGPGLAMSDAGLYCLCRGYGSGKDPGKRSLVEAAEKGQLDPKAAIAAWKKDSPALAEAGLEELLAADAEALLAFQRVWSRTFHWAGTRPTADLFEQVIEELGLDAYWREAKEGGRQAIANLSRFVEHVRELETGHGMTPLELLGALDAKAEDDGLPSGGIETGVDAEVVITTYWQAKGMEWPVVAIPDVDQTKTNTLCSGIPPERIIIPAHKRAGEDAVVFVAGCQQTSPAKPFSTSAVEPLEALRDVWRGPAERAELRRLLYVAMTRAKNRVLLSGSFERKKNADAVHVSEEDPRDRLFGLDQATDWATTLAVCLDLRRVADDLVAGEGSALRQGTEIEIVTVNADGRLEKAEAAVAATESGGEANPAWIPLVSPPVEWSRPSDHLGAAEVPEPMSPVVWPAVAAIHVSPFGSAATEGTAFHEMLRRWAFGGRDGRPLSRELASQAAKERLALSASKSLDAATDRLLDLFRVGCAGNEALVAGLERAAREGRLYPELPIRFRDAGGSWFDGVIDLAWRDESGWHVLDYKTGERHPTADTGLSDPTLREHYAQVALYAKGLRLLMPGEKIADFGVWYVSCGAVARWCAANLL